MAFKIVPSDDVSMFLRPADKEKSFLVTKDDPAVFALPLPPGHGGARRNLISEWSQIACDDEDSLMLPPPSPKDLVKVFLRVKPRTSDESHHYSQSSQQDANSTAGSEIATDLVTLESNHQLAITAPNNSTAHKNSASGCGKMTHRFTFTRIFPSTTRQTDVFEEIVKPRLKEFLEGSNQLLFAYGATSSGKTYTIQGDHSNPGVLPRTLDVLFNSVKSQYVCPDELNIKPSGYNRVGALVPRDKEKTLAEKRAIFELEKALVEEVGNDDSTSSRCQDSGVIPLDDLPLHYAVWISFAEVYNENIYDLLESIPDAKQKGDRPRRTPLKIADDRGGHAYIKGLKEVAVSSADEAYRLLRIGQQNLQFATTRLNHNSSRSHCIFSIKLVRVADIDQPTSARVSMLSFCDLAGSERIKKTSTTGERQKETGSINTSLLVLGRCIKAIRSNQTVKDARRQVVPFRESKLTRLFQSYFTGAPGKVSMIVNISQSPYLFEETLQVLKFSAVASKVQIEPIREPVKEKAKRKTRFSIMVENNKPALFNGRGSIAWENPQFRSTMCIQPDIEEECKVSAEPAEDTKYEGLMKLIDDLKNQLIDEKQKNLKMETEIRAELCQEFNQMLVEIEASSEQRLQEEKDRASELSEWRISKLEEALKQSRRKTRSGSDQHHPIDDEELRQKTLQIENLSEELTALKEMNAALVDENKKSSSEVKTMQTQSKIAQEQKIAVEKQVQQLQKELECSNQALQSQNADTKLAELESTIADLRKHDNEQSEQIKQLKILLDEAGEDYVHKDEEIAKLSASLSQTRLKMDEKDEQIREADSQIEELKALLQQAATRDEEKDLHIFEMEEKLENAQTKEKSNWSAKMASEQEMTTLHDDIESLKSEKKKLKTQLESTEGEVESLQKEVKRLLQADEKVRQLEKELANGKKVLGELETKHALQERTLNERNCTISNLQLALDSIKKEENAIAALKGELEQKRKDMEELQFKVSKSASEFEAVEYDAKRTKEERDKLMKHYEQQLTKMADELRLERRETAKLREVMANTTPMKKNDKELQMLREEVCKKSELIKTLASKVTTPKTPKPESEGCSDCTKLRAEYENKIEALTKEARKQETCFSKIIEQYKDTNATLLKQVPSATANDSEEENKPPTHSEANKSTIETTPPTTGGNNSRRGKRGRKKNNATTQVSFADDANSSVDKEEEMVRPSKRPKRGTRVSKNSRPSSTRKASVVSVQDEQDSDTDIFQTPYSANKKRKLFTNTPKPDVFTPQEDDTAPIDSPHSIVRRQLRSRNIKIKK